MGEYETQENVKNNLKSSDVVGVVNAGGFGAIAGMITGGVMVFVWKLLLNGLTDIKFFDIYELLPAFILSSIAIVVASLLTKKPSAQIEAEFDEVVKMTKA